MGCNCNKKRDDFSKKINATIQNKKIVEPTLQSSSPPITRSQRIEKRRERIKKRDERIKKRNDTSLLTLDKNNQEKTNLDQSSLESSSSDPIANS